MEMFNIETHQLLKRMIVESVEGLYERIRFNYISFQLHGKVIKSQLPLMNAAEQAEAIATSSLHYLIPKLTAF